MFIPILDPFARLRVNPEKVPAPGVDPFAGLRVNPEKVPAPGVDTSRPVN